MSSTTTSPNASPVSIPIQPLHNPSQAAHIVVPKAPRGTVGNQAPGMGVKALLAKKMDKSHNPTFISPTDNLMTPCTQKLNAARKKNFSRGTKPVQLFAQPDVASEDEETEIVQSNADHKEIMEVDGENPF